MVLGVQLDYTNINPCRTVIGEFDLTDYKESIDGCGQYKWSHKQINSHQLVSLIIWC